MPFNCIYTGCKQVIKKKWLINNQFPSIEYGFSRTGGVGNFFEHFSLPLIFLAKQILLLIPFLF